MGETDKELEVTEEKGSKENKGETKVSTNQVDTDNETKRRGELIIVAIIVLGTLLIVVIGLILYCHYLKKKFLQTQQPQTKV